LDISTGGGLRGGFSLENEIRNPFDTAKIFHLEVLKINLCVEFLLEVNQQFHKLLRIENPCVQQVRSCQRHIDIECVVEQFGYLSLDILIFNG
jgi:hypothetical protein